MVKLIVNYHRTVSDPGRAALHVLSDDEFDTQLDCIRGIGLRVIPAEQLCSNDGDTRQAQIGITFDDGCKSDMGNAEKLVKYGWSATFFVSTANIGSPGYLDADDLRELRRMGMVVGSHSHSHVRLTTLPLDEAQHNVQQSKTILAGILGSEVDRFAFPGGAYSPPVLRLIRDARFRYGFGTAWGVNRRMPQLGAGVIRRNNAIHGMSRSEFSNLISLKDLRRRQVAYWLRTAALRMLPEDAYRRVRRVFVQR
jgi:peptidoglycan/xylan/chitin deacetylase (PgdA/CDA1 family)